MTWSPSPSQDATNCYHIVTQQRSVLPGPVSTTFDFSYISRYSTNVCGPPFVWTLPPNPPPGRVQFFCIQAKNIGNLYSVCADITFDHN